MKVLWFSNTPAGADVLVGSNGTGGWLKSLDKAIQNKIELHVVYNSTVKSDDFVVGSTIYHPIYCDIAGSKLQKLFRLYGKVNKVVQKQSYLSVIDKVKPDVIHIHGTEKSFSCIIGETDVPIVVSIQAIMSVVCLKYFSGISKKKAHERNYSSPKRYLLDNYMLQYNQFKERAVEERKNMQSVRNVIGRTDWDRRCMSVIAPKARYFHNDEVLRDVFYKTKWEQSAIDGKIIVHTTTGTLLFKGLETICEAVSLLNSNGVEIEWRIAGISSEDLIVKIVKHQLRDNYPDKGIIYLGKVNETDLATKMLEADMFVYPSHQDNSSNALCEAQLLGMPCIATMAGGTGTLIKDGEDGILLQDGDPFAIAGAILELANDKGLAVRYGEAARAKAMKRHNIITIVEDLVSIYSECATNNKSQND